MGVGGFHIQLIFCKPFFCCIPHHSPPPPSPLSFCCLSSLFYTSANIRDIQRNQPLGTKSNTYEVTICALKHLEDFSLIPFANCRQTEQKMPSRGKLRDLFALYGMYAKNACLASFSPADYDHTRKALKTDNITSLHADNIASLHAYLDAPRFNFKESCNLVFRDYNTKIATCSRTRATLKPM